MKRRPGIGIPPGRDRRQSGQQGVVALGQLMPAGYERLPPLQLAVTQRGLDIGHPVIEAQLLERSEVGIAMSADQVAQPVDGEKMRVAAAIVGKTGFRRADSRSVRGSARGRTSPPWAG